MVTAFFSNWHNWVVNYQHSQPVNQVNGKNQRTVELSRRRRHLGAARSPCLPCLPTTQHGGLTMIPSPPLSAVLKLKRLVANPNPNPTLTLTPNPNPYPITLTLTLTLALTLTPTLGGDPAAAAQGGLLWQPRRERAQAARPAAAQAGARLGQGP